MMAALVAQYPAQEGSTKYPFTEDMFIILPLAIFKYGRNSLEQRNTPPTFTDICAFHSSIEVSAIVLFTWIAALFINASIFKFSSMVLLTSAVTEPGLETSAWQANALPSAA